MIRNLQGHHTEKYRAGLVEDESRAIHQSAAGTKEPDDGGEPDLVSRV